MIQVSNSGDELDRSSGISAPKFTIACVADNSKEEEEEEEIPLKRKKGLCELLTSKAKGLAPKDASGSQPLPTLPLPSVNPFVLANLKKRKNDKEVVEEGEVIPLDEGVPPKLPKTAKGKGRGFSIKSKDAETVAEVRLPNST